MRALGVATGGVATDGRTLDGVTAAGVTPVEVLAPEPCLDPPVEDRVGLAAGEPPVDVAAPVRPAPDAPVPDELVPDELVPDARDVPAVAVRPASVPTRSAVVLDDAVDVERADPSSSSARTAAGLIGVLARTPASTAPVASASAPPAAIAARAAFG